MDTKCSGCTAPITVHTDSPTAPHECEACETCTCKCGSTVFAVQRGMTARKLVCVACDNMIEADFDSAEIAIGLK